jgi:hypothetical protein
MEPKTAQKYMLSIKAMKTPWKYLFELSEFVEYKV